MNRSIQSDVPLISVMLNIYPLSDSLFVPSPGGSHLLEEDMLILRVIESYCTSARARHTLNCKFVHCHI